MKTTLKIKWISACVLAFSLVSTGAWANCDQAVSAFEDHVASTEDGIGDEAAFVTLGNQALESCRSEARSKGFRNAAKILDQSKKACIQSAQQRSDLYRALCFAKAADLVRMLIQ